MSALSVSTTPVSVSGMSRSFPLQLFDALNDFMQPEFDLCACLAVVVVQHVQVFHQRQPFSRERHHLSNDVSIRHLTLLTGILGMPTNTFKSHSTTAISTTTLMMVLILASIGIMLFTSQSRTPITISTTTREIRSINPPDTHGKPPPLARCASGSPPVVWVLLLSAFTAGRRHQGAILGNDHDKPALLPVPTGLKIPAGNEIRVWWFDRRLRLRQRMTRHGRIAGRIRQLHPGRPPDRKDRLGRPATGLCRWWCVGNDRPATDFQAVNPRVADEGSRHGRILLIFGIEDP